MSQAESYWNRALMWFDTNPAKTGGLNDTVRANFAFAYAMRRIDGLSPTFDELLAEIVARSEMVDSS